MGGRNLEPSFWIAGTQVPGIPGTPLAWRVATDYPNDLFDNFVSLYRLDSGFSPTLGFVRRTGIWETTGHIDFMPRPHVLGIRQLDLLLVPSWDIIADESGTLFRSEDWQTADFEWRPLGGTFQSGAIFELNLQRSLDAPADSFDLFHGVQLPPGRYWWNRGEVRFTTSPSHPLTLGSVLGLGDFYDGTDTQFSLSGSWRGAAMSSWVRSSIATTSGFRRGILQQCRPALVSSMPSTRAPTFSPLRSTTTTTSGWM